MNEIQRMQYLSALDVDCYMPRFILPNAAEAKLCQLPLASVVSEAVNDSPAEASQKSSPANFTPSSDAIKAAADVLASLGSSAATPSVEPSLKSEPKSAQPLQSSDSEAAASIEPFSLSLHRIGKLLAIDSRNTETPLPTDRLLANIAFALGYSAPDIAAAEILNWPFSGDNAVMNVESARVDLQAFLDGRLLNSDVDNLLLLGSTAAQFILPENTEYTDNLFKKVSLTEFSVDALIAPSLNELLQDSALKKPLWRVLRDSSIN